MKFARALLLVVLGALLPVQLFAEEYAGDFWLGETITWPFNTYSNSTGADIERTVASTSLFCYPNNSATEITAGITDTGLSEFDGVVGQNMLSIVATTANGYAAGNTYHCGFKAATLNGVTVSRFVVGFSMENRTASKYRVSARFTGVASGSNSTKVVLNNASPDTVTATNQYVTEILWNKTQNWKAGIQATTNGSPDYFTIFPAMPTVADGDVLWVLNDGPVYPITLPNVDSNNNVIVGGFGAAASVQGLANLNAFINNGGADSTASAFIGTLAAAATSADNKLGTITNHGGGSTVAGNLDDLFTASGSQAHGTCDGTSTQTTCHDTSLTQADNYWTNWSAIYVQGQPARCVRGFVNSTHVLSWPGTPLPATAASLSYTIVAAPECRNAP